MLLEKALIYMESMLGRRIDYDELLRIMVDKLLGRRPELLLWLVENPVKDYDRTLALRILGEERARDERFREVVGEGSS
jgi:hypothetical protein